MGEIKIDREEQIEITVATVPSGEVPVAAEPPGRGWRRLWHRRRTRTRTRIEARGIALYGLWSPQDGMPSSDAVTALPQIGGERRQIGLWQGIHLVWRPPRASQTPAWLPADTIQLGWQVLQQHLTTLLAHAAPSPAAAPHGELPAYRIYYVERLRAHVPRQVLRLVRKRRQRAVQQGEQLPNDPGLSAQAALVSELLQQVGIVDVEPSSGWLPSYFSHYDRATGRRGWMVIAPSGALLVGVSPGEVETLASLIQPRDAASAASGGGILVERYEATLGRVAQWNGTQDVFEAVADLQALNEASRKTTDGNAWLSFSLAAIGVLLTLFNGPVLGYGQVIPLGLLTAASVLFALYARSGRMLFQIGGWSLFVVALVVGVLLLAHAPLPGITPNGNR